MKKSLLLLVLMIGSYAYSCHLLPTTTPRPSAGLLFNWGRESSKQTLFTTAARGIIPICPLLSLGTELNYTSYFGKYHNSDAIGGIAFARLTPFKGLFAEAGYGSSLVISSARQAPPLKSGVFLSAGYQLKLTEKFKIELQYRALQSNYTNETSLSKFYLGTYYTF